ncbi:TPA: hypothetical protein HA278_05985 [Candidatus Woesearchaeota archaeon]|nr:hypothetical protein [archaeon]HIJ11581.1 hypothetical protein [Candidatus Woesearchaeota archaeon]|tara:strand:- start:179 stop:469 length:291 start_codon:yes stop_codon:yes gene_type:complete
MNLTFSQVTKRYNRFASLYNILEWPVEKLLYSRWRKNLLKNVRLLLPCNVIIYEDKGNLFVSSIIPSVAMSMIHNDELAKITSTVDEKSRNVIDSV